MPVEGRLIRTCVAKRAFLLNENIETKVTRASHPKRILYYDFVSLVFFVLEFLVREPSLGYLLGRRLYLGGSGSCGLIAKGKLSRPLSVRRHSLPAFS